MAKTIKQLKKDVEEAHSDVKEILEKHLPSAQVRYFNAQQALATAEYEEFKAKHTKEEKAKDKE
jgi:outer membrane PBP1 activator LpoA protein